MGFPFLQWNSRFFLINEGGRYATFSWVRGKFIRVWVQIGALRFERIWRIGG